MKWDLILWLAFFAGQCLFILKRAALAVRSPMNAVRSRWQYVGINLDILFVRTVLEFAIVYFPFRHPDQIAGWFHITVPFHIPSDSAVAILLLGYLSDSTTDWITMQDKILGIPVPSWVQESIPTLPQVKAMVAGLDKKENSAT